MTVAAGTRIGPYEIVAPLGAGGMGEVYRARDPRLAREVAIKILPPAFAADPDRLRRFEEEARAAGQLNHPNILTLYDVGAHEGAPYIVSELLEGHTLRGRLEDGPLAVREAIDVARQLAQGLAAAHDKGIVHRDLKPENLFLTSDQRLKILDFGIAKLTRPQPDSAPGAAWDRATETTSGTVLGTAGYMSPEQVRGLGVDRRSDLFSCGAILYELLTGRRAFVRATAADTAAAILSEDPVLPAKMPRALRALIMHCLAKSPAARFQSAHDLAFDLESLRSALAGSRRVSARSLAAGVDVHAPPEVEPARANTLVERRFTLSEPVCRLLDRATLDPRIIGDQLTYVDNQVRSDVLVVFLHGLGLDHRDFGPILERLPYRGVSPTLYGCEPDRRTRISLGLADHVIVLREWLRTIAAQAQPTITAMVGFSLGADIGLELLHTQPESPSIDGFLSLECNLSLETCLFSRMLAEMTPGRGDALVAQLRQVGAASSLAEWLNIHEYLVKVLRKFQHDIGPLQRAAADIVRPLAAEPGFEQFARRFRSARSRVSVLRLVFTDGWSAQVLARLKLENLDNRILGEDFPDGVFTVAPHGDHFDLMHAQTLVEQVGQLVKDVRAARSR